MPKFKSILVGCRIVRAGRKRKCYHNRKHEIRKGEIVLEAKSNMNWQGYCRDCADEMFKETTREIEKYRAAL